VQAAATPAKRALLALFFIAIGIAIDLREVAAHGGALLLYLPILLLIKFATVLLLGDDVRCTPDMGMSLWGESPLWEDPMPSG